MSAQLDPRLADNLRRWQQSGQPYAWVDAHGGQWGHGDWLTLLANLRHSPFWPLDPAAVQNLLDRLARERANLHRLIRSEMVARWVEARQGEWGHADWLALLDVLHTAGYWPIKPEAVRSLLEGLTRQWHNLRAWEQSGAPRRWVEAHGGEWTHGDWLELVVALQQSEFWPLDLHVVGALLERCKGSYRNLRLWVASGWPRRWVEAHRGRWGHDDWNALLEAVRWSPYWPLDAEAAGEALDEVRRMWLNLRRWERSGEPRQWVNARRGRWGHGDWLDLLDGLRRSEFWPLELEAVGEVLADLQQEWRNLGRWHESGEVWWWIETHQGRWDRDQWLALWADLQVSAFGPLDAAATEEVLRQVTAEWWNLRYWRDSGQPRRWVEARQGRWDHDEWLALLDSLRRSPYWPLEPVRVGVVLEQAKREYGNLQRWEASGQPRRWAEARGGQWDPGGLAALLDDLQHSEFWPLDPVQVEGLLEQSAGEVRNLRRWRESGAARRWVEARPGGWGDADWQSLLEELRASEFWPVSPAGVGRMLEEIRAGTGSASAVTREVSEGGKRAA
ncbi:MAG: hypothetical protein IT429_25095 [Gemmataceae bacterium]|nr:hypothetical protein [Gemmataceae bacterium]